MQTNTHKWVIPKEGRQIRDPRSKAVLPVEGTLKPWTGPQGRYWRRQVTIFKDATIDEQKTIIALTPPAIPHSEKRRSRDSEKEE